jgi:hypothetical protein
MLRLVSLLAVATLAPAVSAQFQVEWGRAFDNVPGNPEDGFFTAVTTASSGRVFAAAVSGQPRSSAVVCFSPTGTKLWHRSIPQGNSWYSRVYSTDSGDVLFVGYSAVLGATTCDVRSYNPNGVLNWTRSLPTSAASPRAFQSRLDASGELVLVGRPLTPATQLRYVRIAPDSTLTVDTLFDPIPGATEEALDLDLADNGDALVCGTAGTENYVARISPAGQLVWQQVVSSPASGSIQLLGVRAALDGNVVTLENEVSGSFGPRQTFRRFSPSGTPLGFASIDEPLGQSFMLSGFERSSDGALWTVGMRPSPASQLVVTRCDSEVQDVRKHVLDHRIDASALTPPSLMAATAGQVWVSTTAWAAPAPSVRHGAVLLFGPDIQRGPQVRVRVGLDAEQRVIRHMALSSSNRLIVAGLGDSFFGPLGLYFDPIPWLGQVDVSAAPSMYCEAQTDSAGCTPNLIVSGVASSNPTDDFAVRCLDVSPQRSGLFFYGLQGPTSVPLGGGTLCVASPVRRGPLLDSGASTSACGGQLDLDWAGFAAGTLGGFPHPSLQLAGTEVCAQGWIRDAALPVGALLSAAVRWVVLP